VCEKGGLESPQTFDPRDTAVFFFVVFFFVAGLSCRNVELAQSFGLQQTYYCYEDSRHTSAVGPQDILVL